MYVELIERSKNNRHHIVPLSSIDPRVQRDYEAYVSLLPFGNGIIEHMKLTADDAHPNGTISGYAGDYYCRYFFFDIDCKESLEMALKSTRMLVNRLINEYGVPKGDVLCYFSGMKGFHISIASEHFSGFSPSNDLPNKIKLIAEQICSGIPHIDYSLYSVNRFFRLPNSKHPDTGLWKVPLFVEELGTGTDRIKEIASEPRLDFVFSQNSLILPKEKLVAVKNLVYSEPEETPEDKEILSGVPVSEGDRFKVAVSLVQRKYSKEDYFAGNRNNYMHLLSEWCNDIGIGQAGDGSDAERMIRAHCQVDLADDPASWDQKNVSSTILGVYRRKAHNFGKFKNYLALKRSPREKLYETEFAILSLVKELSERSRLSLSRILFLAENVNENRKAPLSREDVYRIVMANANTREERSADDLGAEVHQLAAPFVEILVRQAKGDQVGIGFLEIDEAEQYFYEGKYFQIIGKGGVGKSILLTNFSRSIASYGKRSVLSTMEDNSIGLFKRIIKQITDPEIYYDEMNNPINVVDQISSLRMVAAKNPTGLAKRLAAELRLQYGDLWIIDEMIGMDFDAYLDLCTKIIRKYGSLAALCVDGHSTMGGSGMGEVQDDIRNAKGLKDLANHLKIGVFDLVHVPSSIDAETRSLEYNTRSGTKVMEHADAYISLSKIRNYQLSSPGEPVYLDDYIYLRYWGKRTSGVTVNKILFLDRVHVDFEVMPDDADNFVAQYSKL